MQHNIIILFDIGSFGKKENNRIFEGKENNFVNIKDRWFHYYGSIVLGHNLDNLVDLGSVVDMLIDL